ncbi:MAG: hypothetical protein ACRYE9_00945 [Janthinobacterium lividum]
MNAESISIAIICNLKLTYKADSLAKSGVLVQNGSYYFLKINGDFINKLHPLLSDSRKIEKLDYFSAMNSTGAHITIAYDEEQVIFDADELGQKHNFIIGNLCNIIFGSKKILHIDDYFRITERA